MRVLYLGKTHPNIIYNDTVYDAVSKDKDYFYIKDDSGMKNIYPKKLFKEIHIICRGRYSGESSCFKCIDGHIYDITSLDEGYGWFQVIDETRQLYLYPRECFEIIPNNVNIVDLD